MGDLMRLGSFNSTIFYTFRFDKSYHKLLFFIKLDV